MPRFFFTLLLLLAGNLYAQDVRISEFLATNVNGLRDENGDPSGWIELYNPSPAAKVILTGWKLTTGATEFTFPAFEIMPAEHIIVWASGKNRTVTTAPLHTNFTLPAEGSYLGLLRANGTVASEFAPSYPAQQPDVSYGRDAANPTLTGFYTDPTPNQENNYSGTGVAGKVVFSVGSKAYTGSLSLTLDQVPPDPQAVIRYTTNGSVPQAAGTTTFDYTGPITVSTTQIIRARVFKPGLLPGETESASYLLLNGTTMNFSSAMPMVVISNFGGGIPPETGDQAGFMWVFEKGADGRSRLSDPPAIATRIAMDRRGSSTIGNPKFNLNVEARKARDDYDRNIPLLGMPAESDWVFHAPYSFDPALVRNPFAFALSNSIKRYAPRNRMAEVFIDTNASDLNFGGTGAVNNYFGIYNVLEKIRRGPERVKVTPLNTYDNGPVEKTGGYIVKVDRKDPGDVGFITPREGPGRSALANGFAYYEPKEIELRSPQRDPQEQYIGVAATGSPIPLIGFLTDLDNAAFGANYRDPVLGFRRYLDEDAAIDHHLLNVWPMNVDAMRLSGYMSKERGGKIVYGPVWDYDRSLESTDGRDDNPAVWRGQGGDQGTDFFNYTWWSRMFTDPDFYQRYIDRWVELRRNEFSQASVNALLDALNAEMSAEGISRDLARWNQAKRPFQGMTGQAAEIARIKDWLQRRVVFMENQWVKPVAITPAAGNVAPGTVVTMTAATVGSTIYYTADGSDPRPPGGTAPTTALPYTGPITVNATMRIRARAYHPTFTALTGANNPPIVSRWSGRTDARYSTDAPAGAGNLVVTELNYHPFAPTTAELEVNPVFAEGDFEFIEVKNIGTAPIDLGGARFTAGIEFSFAGENAFTLEPGAHAIIAANPAGFAARYGAHPNLVGGFVGDLDNGGERLLLIAASGATILDFTYDDLWHPSTDGTGQTLVIYDQGAPEPAFSTVNNWRPSSAPGGSPGGGEPPFVITMEATAITATSAQLNAEVSPNGTATSLDFVVGADRIATPGVPATNSATVVGQNLTGLAPHTLYSYRAEAANPLGVRAGTEVLFTTLNRVPTPVADEMHILQREPFAIDVLASDTDPDSDTLTIISVTQGAFGTVSTDGNSVLYAPGANYSGADSFSYTVSDGFGGETSAVVTLTNAPPVALGDLLTTNGEPVTFDPRSNDTDADNDPLAVSGTTQGAVGVVAVTAEGTISYTPGSQFFGRDTFTYTVTDGAATATETVSVRSSAAVSIVRASSGQQVPGAEPGTVYAKLGAPSNGSFLGKVQMSSGDREGAVFATDGTMRLKVGDPAPGVAGAFIKKLQEPSGQAVVAKLRGTGVNEKNDTVLYLGLYEATIRLGLRVGELLPGGSTLKKVLSIDGNGSTVFVRCSLSGPLVDKSNKVALLALPPGSGVRLLAREGDVVLGRPITSLGTLVGSSGTLAEGRWRAGDDSIGVRLSFADDAHALYSIPADATSPAEWIEWGKTGDVYAGLGTAASFGLPGFAPDGASFLAQLALGSGAGVVKANDTSILRATAAGVDLLAAEGAAVPDGTGATLPGLTFKKFGDPIAGANSSTAFAATLAGAGVKENNRAGLWFAAEESLAMIARAGDLAPGGGRWEKFQSLVLPDGLGHGPIFTAKLVVKSSEGVTSATNRGIWGIDSEGTLRLLLRTGQVVSVNGASRTVSKFVALTPPDGSLGAAHGVDDQGATNVLVTFTDGTQAIIGIALP